MKRTILFLFLLMSIQCFSQSSSAIESDWERSDYCSFCLMCECVTCPTKVTDRDLYGNEYTKSDYVDIPVEKSYKYVHGYCGDTLIGKWKIVRKKTCRSYNYYWDAKYALGENGYYQIDSPSGLLGSIKEAIKYEIDLYCEKNMTKKSDAEIEPIYENQLIADIQRAANNE